MNSARRFHRGRQNAARPSIELLEVRLLPALILWDGGPAATGSNWNDPVNWAGDALPGANDDAQIGGTFAGMTVTASGQVAVRSLSTAASLKVTAGTFALGAATSRIDAALEIDGGTLQLGGTTLNGAGTLTNTATVQLSNSKITAPLVNQGTLLVHGTTALDGALSNLPGGTLRVDGIGLTSGASLTVARGFTNQGTIELTADSGWSGDMTVSSGTLTNAVGATIRVPAGGSRSLAAQLDNRGLLDVRSNLFSLGKPSAAHTNSGAISVTGGLVVSQSGTSPSFTNTGSITIGSGGSFSLSGGAFNHTAGTIRGAGTWSLSRVTAGFGGDFDNGVGSVLFSNSTVNSPGTFRNAAGNTVTLTAGSVVNAALSNQGTLVVQGNATLDGAFGNLPGGTLRVDGSALTSGAHLTVASGFTNQGTIEMTGDQNWFSQLTVSSGTLTNAVGGSIHVRPSGDRSLEAQLDNQGLFDAQLDVQNRLTISKTSAAHTNSGTITFSGGNFTIGQPGTAQSFTNTGVLDVGGNAILTVATGITNDGSGILTGQPSGTLAIGGNLAGATTNADLFAPQAAIRFTGPGTAGHPQLLEVLGEDLGDVGAGFTNNFALATLSLDSTYVRLVDNADNAPGAGPETLYVDRLIVPAGATLDLNSFHVYARQTQINGTVLGGTVAQAPDGGPIALNSTTAGTIGATGEVDEWTFFGRAGQAVTILANPGAAGAPAPLPPMLNIANVRLVGPSGALIASGSSASSGQIATLQAVPLPADGTYRIQVRAAAGGDRGDYTLALWNATVNTRPLVVNQQTNGVLETSFSVDRWTFTAAANQQVSFDWINAAPATLQFKLTGPNNFTGFSGLTGDSGLVTLLANGTYTVEVTAGANQGGSYAFRLVESSQTVLTLGMPYVGTMIANGQYQLFRVDLPAGQQLRVVLDDAHDNNRNELYAQFGSPPTRAHFDFSATTASADQQLFVPAAAPGTWYVLIYSPSVPSPGSFTLTADAGALFLSSTTPDYLGNGTDMTLTLTGAGFDRTTIVELLDSGGATYPADALSFDTPTHLTATFAAGSLPPGTYSVRARRPAGGEADLADAFRVVAGGHSNLEANLDVPAFAYYGPTLQYFYVEYANTGDAPMLAPLLVVHSTNNAKLRLDDHRLVQGARTSAGPDGFSDTVQINGSGATAGLLQPGERVTVRVDYVGLQQPYDFGDNIMHTTLSVFTSDNTPIDWPSLQDTLRPPGISAEAWVPIFANLVAQVGPTWSGFQSMLSDNAQYLARLGQTVTDVDSLWQFEVEQAIGFSPVSTLESVTDIQVDAPGLPITLTRSFFADTVGRYEQGPLGRGWAVADGWDQSLTTEEDGTVVVSGTDGHERRFEPDGRTAGVYFSQAGDHGTLTGLGGGVFVLREPDGLVTRYRSDGRVDYIEDPNGNRITATWTGTLLTRLTHSAGQFLQITYNSAGRIASLMDQAGRTVVYTYDISGEHLLSVRGIDGQTTQYTYGTGALAHALGSIQYPDNTHQYFTYDTHGRLDSMSRDNNAERVSFTYDSAGRVTATDALGNATKYFFDAQDQLAAVEDALGRRTLFSHDEDFNLTQITDARGQNYLYQYDGQGHVVRATNPLGQVTLFSYTADFDGLSSMTDARGNSLNYGYDSRGNLTSITYADGSVENFAVDPRGELDGWTNRRGQLVDYRVDSDGRLERRDQPDGSFVEYHYDARGNVIEAIDATGTTQLEYLDPRNPDLVTKITYPDGQFLEYTYQNERRTSMVDQDGFTTNYLYDAAGRLEFLRDGAGNLIVQYQYDAAGRLVREDKGNGTFTEYQYDAAGQLEHLINEAPDGTVNSRFDYAYDALGRRTRMTTLDGVWDYTYDSIGELTRAVFTSNNPAAIPDQDLQYVYDAVGNRIRTIINGVTTDYVTNDLNQYTQIGAATLAYDLDGNLVSRTDGGATTTYAFDALNRLTGVTAPGRTSSYQYDAFDNLAAAVQNGQRTGFLIDPFGLGDVVAEHDASGSLIAHYTYGLGLTSRTNSSGVAAYYDFDATGSTAGVTGTAGTYLDSYSYLPFGESLRSAESIGNPFQFVGQFGVMQESNGLDFMRARFYAPVDGRFIAPDPSGLAGGQINLYGYVAQDPVTLSDPSGRFFFAAIGIVFFAGGLVGGHIQHHLDRNAEIERQKRTIRIVTFNNLNGFVCKQGNSKSEECQWVEHARKHIDQGADLPGLPPTLGGPTTGPITIIDWPAPDDLSVRAKLTRLNNSRLVRPLDPNEKTGSAGFGPSQFIAADGILPYHIEFENEVKATAPAHRVVVTDQLDANLDWDTFAWTAAGFGDVVLTIPAGSQHYQTTVPMTENGRTFQVEIELDLDPQTGLLTAVFDSIDPATSLPPDGLTGFLPPEDGSGRGQGWISYIVRPKAGLPTGTSIRNIARITFDVNAPIDTNQVDPHDPSKGTDPAKEAFNTIDAGPPTSRVVVLPSHLTTSAFTVAWSGADDSGGSGIGSYSIYVSDNGGPFAPWLTATTQTSATFTGVDGHTYRFFAQATDNAGNQESLKSAPEATTTVIALAPPLQPPPAVTAAADDSGTKGDGITDDATPVFTGTTEPEATIQLLNGTQVLGTATADASGHYRVSPQKPLSPGTYQLTVVASNPLGSSRPSEPLSLTIVAPPVTPSAPDLHPADSNGSPGGETTYLASPHLTGTALAGAIVQLLDSTGAVLNAARADGSGTYQIQVPGPLGIGSFSFRVAVVDQYGDMSSPSASRTITVAHLSPPVVVESLKVAKIKVGKGKKAKKETVVVLQFSGALNATAADNTVAYELAPVIKAPAKGKGRNQKAPGFKLGKPVTPASAIYTDSTRQVTLIPRGTLNPAKPQELIVTGGLLTDTDGRQIDGNDDGRPGGDYIATISRGRATVGGVPLSRSSATPALVAAAVDAVFARDEQQGASFIHSGHVRPFHARAGSSG